MPSPHQSRALPAAALSKAAIFTLLLSCVGDGVVDAESPPVTAFVEYDPSSSAAPQGSFIDAIRFGATVVRQAEQNASAGGAVAVPCVVVLRMSGVPRRASFPWAAPSDFDGVTVEFASPLSELRVDAQGALFECGAIGRRAGVLRVTAGKLLVANASVARCVGAPSSAGSAALIVVDAAQGSAAWEHFRLSDFVRVRFALVTDGALSLDNVTFVRFLNASGALVAQLAGCARATVRGGAVLDCNDGPATLLNTGGVLSLDGTATATVSSLVVANLTVTASVGGIVGLSGLGVASLTNVTASSVQSRTGCFVAAGDQSQFSCDSSVGYNLFAVLAGAAFDLHGAARGNVTRVQTHSTRSVEGGFVASTADAHLFVSDVEATDTFAAGAGGFLGITGGLTGSVVMRDSRVTRASAGVAGGFMVVLTSAEFLVEVSGLVLVDASSPHGGMLLADGDGRVRVQSSTIVSATAMSFGGVAIVFSGANVLFQDCAIASPSSTMSGGVLFASGSEASLVTFVRCRVDGAWANYDGGGLLVSAAARVRVVDSHFDRSGAAHCGGFAAVELAGVLAVERTNLTNASALVCGGSFSVRGVSELSASGIVAKSSRALRHGGFLYATDNGRASVADTRISGTSTGEADVMDYAVQLMQQASRAMLFLNYLAVATGGTVTVESAADVRLRGLDVRSSNSSGGGGCVAVVGNDATLSLSDSTLRGSRAFVGGGILVGAGARASLANVSFSDVAAASDGGCVYVGRGARIDLSNATFAECRAGLVVSSFGAGGFAFLGSGAACAVTSPSSASHVSAVLGAGVFCTDPLAPSSSLANLTVSRPIPVDSAEVPDDWEGGGIFAGSVSRLAPAPASAEVPSGGTLPPFSISIVDVFGGHTSLPSDRSLAVRLFLDAGGADNAQSSTTAHGGTPQLVGDKEKNFATAPNVSYSGLRVYAPPGTYNLRALSANPYMYGRLDPSSTRRDLVAQFSISVRVTACDPYTETLVLDYVNEDPSLGPLWHCRALTYAGASDKSATLAKTVTPAVVLSVWAAVCIAFVVRWRVLAHRRDRSRAAQEEFVARQGEMLDRLAPFEVTPDHFEILEGIGEGEFGLVNLSRVVIDGRPRVCAAKSLKEGSYEERVTFIAEAQLLAGLSHPNVLSLCGCVTAEEPLRIFCEYCPYGDLQKFVFEIPQGRRTATATQATLLNFSCQIAAGMAYVAAAGIVWVARACRWVCFLVRGVMY